MLKFAKNCVFCPWKVTQETDSNEIWRVSVDRGYTICCQIWPPPQKGGEAPNFLAHVYCTLTAGWIKMTLGMEVGLGPGHIVLDRTQLPPQKGDRAPNFRPNSIVAKRLCIRIPRGTEVGLSLCDIVLDRDPAPLP